MIQKIVALALRFPAAVLLLVVAIVAGGLYAYRELDIEAYPDPVPPLVELIAQPEGWSAEEVERYVTIPLEIGLAGMPGLEHIRSQSLFGLSNVKCYFKWGTDYWAARQEVINRLQFIDLPDGVKAELSPWSAIGEIFRYRLKGEGYTLEELKTAQDWILEREFRQIPGVIDVVGYGGETRQYQVAVDPYRLRGKGVSLSDVTEAIENANRNVGGQHLTIGEQSYDVRGIGLIKGERDIEDIVVATHDDTPVRLRDVAETRTGPAPRLGIVGHDDEADVVQGIVVMRHGESTQPTLQGVYERIEHIRAHHLLPPGMEIEPYYDRGQLVKLTTKTVLKNMLEGMALVTLVLVLFLGNTRAALITAINIPLALLIAFMGMVLTGTPANLLSLGAIDFGIVVDSTVIMVENIFRHLGRRGSGTMKARSLAAAREVGQPVFFSTLIIAVTFLPLITMTGVSGVIFSPMAYTYAFAIGGAILLALTLTPVLMSKLVPPETEDKEGFVMRALHKVYDPFFEAALKRPKRAMLFRLLPIVGGIALFPLLGREFMPKLEEGNLYIRASLSASVSLEESAKYVGRMRDIVRGCPKQGPCVDENREYPEVLTVVSQLGRPDDGTDASGFYNIEIFAPLRPSDEWRKGLTKEKLTDQLQTQLEAEFPGVVFNFSQMIADNVEEGLSGVKGENSVKVIGPRLFENEAVAAAIVDVMSHVPGVEDLGMFSALGQPNVTITIDRAACARHGLNTGDVGAVIEAAIGGTAVTQVYEGEKHFDLVVRWLAPYRASIGAIRQITVSAPEGVAVPLGQLASIVEEEGPSRIYREGHRRYTPVKFSVRGRDLGSTIEEARERISESVKLPYDMHLEWGGQINELKQATNRLMVIIPLTLLLVTMLVYFAVKNWLDTLIVMVDIPVACTGGVLALLATGNNFSVSAAMGFVSIFGIAIQDAILVVTYYQRMRENDRSIEQAAREAAEQRFRPVLMTTLVAMIGLLPAALSNGIGAQTQKPLAVVVIGGALILAVLTRVLQPPLLVFAHQWREGRQRRPLHEA